MVEITKELKLPQSYSEWVKRWTQLLTRRYGEYPNVDLSIDASGSPKNPKDVKLSRLFMRDVSLKDDELLIYTWRFEIASAPSAIRRRSLDAKTLVRYWPKLISEYETELFVDNFFYRQGIINNDSPEYQALKRDRTGHAKVVNLSVEFPNFDAPPDIEELDILSARCAILRWLKLLEQTDEFKASSHTLTIEDFRNSSIECVNLAGDIHAIILDMDLSVRRTPPGKSIRETVARCLARLISSYRTWKRCFTPSMLGRIEKDSVGLPQVGAFLPGSAHEFSGLVVRQYIDLIDAYYQRIEAIDPIEKWTRKATNLTSQIHIREVGKELVAEVKQSLPPFDSDQVVSQIARESESLLAAHETDGKQPDPPKLSRGKTKAIPTEPSKTSESDDPLADILEGICLQYYQLTTLWAEKNPGKRMLLEHEDTRKFMRDHGFANLAKCSHDQLKNLSMKVARARNSLKG